MLTPKQLRALFPATARSTYLNAAAASPIALPVEKAIADHYREAVEWGDVGFGGWIRRKDETRAELAQLIGAEPQELAFTSSTSIGFGAVGRVLKARGVREVLTLANEFPSTTLPLLNAGLRLRVLSPRPDGSYPVEDLDAALSRATGAIAASAVQFSSGYRLDVEAVGKLCRARRLYFAVNGAQALGQIPVDVRAGHVDFLCATSHKWLMGGYGVGIFFARRGMLSGSSLPYAGWLSTKDPMAMDNLVGAKVKRLRGGRIALAQGVAFRGEASALEAGSSPWGPVFGLQAALGFIRRVGLRTIEAHNARLQVLLRRRLRSLGFSPNAPDGREVGSGICVFPVDGPPRELARSLAKRKVLVSARGVGLRVSTHVFNDEGDLDQLFWAFQKVGVRPA